MAFFLATPVWAKEYRLVLPAGPGSTLDLVGRTIAKSYNKISGNNLIVENKPGGDGLIAVAHFKNTPGAVILGNTTMHAFNYHYRPQPLPYSDGDFDHVGFVGWAPQIWYANPKSGIKTPADLKKVLGTTDKPFFAGDNTLNFVNGNSLVRHLNLQDQVKGVRYKTSPEAVTSTIGGLQPIGVGTLTPVLLEHVKAGNLVIVGSSGDRDFSVDGINIPSISKATGAQQFSGGYVLSMNKQFNKDEIAQMHKDLSAAIQSPESQEEFKRLRVLFVGSDGATALKILTDYRASIGQFK